jgi:hypothetical protein
MEALEHRPQQQLNKHHQDKEISRILYEDNEKTLPRKQDSPDIFVNQPDFFNECIPF